MSDEATFEEIDEKGCLELLASQSVGRVAVVKEGRPLIFPVNYVCDDGTVAFRSDPGTKLEAAVFGPIAFEIDGVDPLYHEGWSVVVRGTGREITGALNPRARRVTERELESWAGGPKRHWVAIMAPTFSGRRIGRALNLTASQGRNE